MKEQGRAFQCEPCREIIIFFAVSDASPYIAASTARAGDPTARRYETTMAASEAIPGPDFFSDAHDRDHDHRRATAARELHGQAGQRPTLE